MSSKIHSIDVFIGALDLVGVDWLETSGRYGWETQLWYRGVHVYYGGIREDVCIELSGTGCRTVEEFSGNTFDWFAFLKFWENDILNGDIKVSRLDIAVDDHEGILDFAVMFRHCSPKLKKYICKASFCTRTDGSEEHIYFGSPASDRRLRIYNKAIEQKVEGHWIRAEMQFRDKTAISFILNWFNTHNVGACYAGVLRDFLRFTTTSAVRASVNNHQSRLVIEPWWDKFLGRVQSLSQLYIDGSHYDMDDVEHFLRRQTSSSLKLWLAAHNGDMTDLMDIIESAKLNKRQIMLLDSIRMGEYN